MNLRIAGKFLFYASTFLLIFSISVFAGNIDPDGDGHKYAYGENIGWNNLFPSQGPGVTVEDDKVVGYLWSENIGWIKLDPTYGGVLHDGQGNLSGYAWSENCGWINFSCTTENTCGSVSYGVTIDVSTGVLSGQAWGENIGWITFDYTGFTSPENNYAKTSWRINGDISSNGTVSLEDAIMALQLCTGITPGSSVHAGADVSGDYRIGIAEATYVLQKVSGILTE